MSPLYLPINCIRRVTRTLLIVRNDACRDRVKCLQCARSMELPERFIRATGPQAVEIYRGLASPFVDESLNRAQSA
jgi:hypothetical protein